MFFKKKPQPPIPTTNVPQELTIFTEITKTLFFGMNQGDNTATLSAQLSFDDQQRVSGVHNILINSVPKLPSPDLLEALNKISIQLMTLDEKYRLKGLDVRVTDGQFHTSADYLISQ